MVTQAEIDVIPFNMLHVGPVAVAVGNLNRRWQASSGCSGVLVSLRTLIINSN